MTDPHPKSEERAAAMAWCAAVADDVTKRLDDTWPNDPLLTRCERAFRRLFAEVDRLERLAYPIGRTADNEPAQRIEGEP